MTCVHTQTVRTSRKSELTCVQTQTVRTSRKSELTCVHTQTVRTSRKSELTCVQTQTVRTSRKSERLEVKERECSLQSLLEYSRQSCSLQSCHQHLQVMPAGEISDHVQTRRCYPENILLSHIHSRDVSIYIYYK